jgi:uncharacterized MAPEG superfamily protein
MTIPVWVLLLFALWTLLVLIVSVGTYRLSRIFKGQSRVREYAFPDLDKSDWHRRATRAHLNCVENLPVYGAIVVVIVISDLHSMVLDRLAVVFLAARIAQTLTHLLLPQTGRVTILRFVFFTVQLICMLWMGSFVVWKTYGSLSIS